MSGQTKTLRKGSVEPPLAKGLYRVYSHRFCPYAFRVRVVIAAKKIPHEIVNINLADKPEWFLAKNPLGKVPALEGDNDTIYESLIIADYLDEANPNPKLHSEDPLLKAKNRILIEYVSKLSGPMHAMLLNPGSKDASFAELNEGIAIFEKELDERGTPFFEGSGPAMADFMIWPFAARLLCLAPVHGPQYEFAAGKFPHVSKWIGDMQAQPLIKKCSISTEFMTGYLKSVMAGASNYDFGLD